MLSFSHEKFSILIKRDDHKGLGLRISQRSYIIAQHLSAYSVAPFGFKSNLLINTIYRYL